MALSKYERGVTRPSADVLARLLATLDIEAADLDKPPAVVLHDVEYRTVRELGLSSIQEKRILADVTQQVETRLECERLIPALRPGPRAALRLPREVRTFDAIESVADEVRRAWSLSDAPIKNLIQTVESHGYRVFTTAMDDGDRFDGFSAVHDGEPVIVLGTGWTGDRQRFTLAHELGHHLLRDRLAGGIDDEQACHRFAGALLVPKAKVVEILGWHRKAITPYELYVLKHEWGISMQAWVYRAYHVGVIGDAALKAQWAAFRRNRWFRTEPLDQYPIEQPFRLYTAVARELQASRIEPSMAARLLKMPQEDLIAMLMLGS